MEIVALLLAWAFALTFVAFTSRPKQRTAKVALVRVPARLPRNEVLRRINRQR